MNRYNSKFWNASQLDTDISKFVALVDFGEYEDALKLADKIQKDPEFPRFHNRNLFLQNLKIAKQKAKE